MYYFMRTIFIGLAQANGLWLQHQDANVYTPPWQGKPNMGSYEIHGRGYKRFVVYIAADCHTYDEFAKLFRQD